MTKSFLIKVFLIVCFLVIGVGCITQNYLKNTEEFAKPTGILNTTQNEVLRANINTFMESRVNEYAIGKEDYYCANFLYGFDEKYAYAWVYCSGFEIQSNDEIIQGTAFSIPTLLQYMQPNFQITDFKQPSDGNLYDESFRQLFPKKIYDRGRLSNVEVTTLDLEVRRKVKAVIQLKTKYPELKDYPSDKLPPRSIVFEQEQSNLYVAFVQNGSGRAILEARCFLIKPNNTIVENVKFTPNSVNVSGLNFSAKECNSY